MSLYLQVAVGAGLYLLDATHIRAIDNGADLDLPAIDLRALFAEKAATVGTSIVVEQVSGEAAVLVVDRIDGLIEIGEAELRPLPPIGALGLLLDAVSLRLVDDRPLLRLRGERARHTAAAFA